jgi:hypothetical protein
MQNTQTPQSGEAADGLDDVNALTSQDPADAGKTGDGTATDDATGNETQAGEQEDTRDVFSELTGDDDEIEEEKPEKPAATDADRKTDDAKPTAEKADKDGEQTQEKPAATEDNPNDPPRRRIKNLEKIRDKLTEEREALKQERTGLTDAFKALNQGFTDAGLDPAKGLDELQILAKAKAGDQTARQEVAKRYGITVEAPATPAALNPKQLALLEEMGLTEEWEAASAAPKAKEAPESKQAEPAKESPAKPVETGPTRDELLAKESMSLIAQAVRQAEPEQAQKILTRASEILQATVHEHQSHPSKWGELFRKAVGTATAEAKAPARTTQRTPRTLRGQSSSGGSPSKAPANGIDADFPGLFDS